MLRESWFLLLLLMTARVACRARSAFGLDRHRRGRLLLFVALVAAASVVSRAADITVYQTVLNPLPGNTPSVGYEATSTFELGNRVAFDFSVSGLAPLLKRVDVQLSSWACESDSAPGPVGPCVTTPGATFQHPLTLNLYQVNGVSGLGALIHSITTTFTIPYRPSATPLLCPNSTTAWFDASSGLCFNGFNNVQSFNLVPAGLFLPSQLIFGLAYNTQHYGAVPTGTPGPFNSLNFAVTNMTLFPNKAIVGTTPDPYDAYWHTTAAFGCTAPSAPLVPFQLDVADPVTGGCWIGYTPAISFIVDQIPTACTESAHAGGT